MRKAAERAARLTGESFWIPAGLGRLPATFAVAAVSVVALVSVFVTNPRITVTVRADALPSAHDRSQCSPAQPVDTIARTVCTNGYGESADRGATSTGRRSDGAGAPINVASGSSTLLGKAPVCDGDGTSGNRIAFYYAYFAGQPNDLAAARKNLINVVERANALVYESSEAFGADQSLRIVTDSNCVPLIRAIELPAVDEDSFNATVRDAHLDATNRKYVLFANTAHYCGLGTLDFDDQPGSDNVNNGGPSWARIDLGCWTGAVTAHEIFHMLGAVQKSAPHYDGTGHCTDDFDLMCYQSADGKPVSVQCPDPVMQQRLDCGGDDYYNPHPAPGSYLATHWNTANSSFLYGGGSPRTTPPITLAAEARS
jgi:hypothetical protein